MNDTILLASFGPSSSEWRQRNRVSAAKDQGLSCCNSWAFNARNALVHQNWWISQFDGTVNKLLQAKPTYGEVAMHGRDCRFHIIYGSGSLQSESTYPHLETPACSMVSKLSCKDFYSISARNETLLRNVLANKALASLKSFQLYSEEVFDDPNCLEDETSLSVPIMGYGNVSKETWVPWPQFDHDSNFSQTISPLVFMFRQGVLAKKQQELLQGTVSLTSAPS